MKRRQGRINLGHFHCLALLLYPALWPLAYIRHRARFSQFYPRDLNGRDLLKATTVIILAAKSGTLLNLLWKPDGLGVDPNFTQLGQACQYSTQHLLKEADFWIHFTFDNRCHLYCCVRKCSLSVVTGNKVCLQLPAFTTLVELASVCQLQICLCV